MGAPSFQCMWVVQTFLTHFLGSLSEPLQSKDALDALPPFPTTLSLVMERITSLPSLVYT